MKTIKLDNGLCINLVPVKGAKIFKMMFIVRTGISYETPSTLGYSHLLEHMFIDSNPNFTGIKGIEELEKKGIDSNASTSHTCVDYYFTGSAKYWETIFDFMSECLVNPKFTQKVFTREKHAVIEELKNHLDDSRRKFKDTIQSVLYDPSILGKSVAATLENTKKCKLNDIKKFYKNHYSPQNVSILIMGKFPMAKIVKKLSIFNNFTNIIKNDLPNIHVNNIPKTIFVQEKKIDKTYCNMIFQLKLKSFDHDFYTAKVLEYILTDGFLSVLYKILRIEKKYIYHMSTELSSTYYDSDFAIIFNTDTKNFKNCIKCIFDSLNDLKKTINKKAYNMARQKIKTDWEKVTTNNKFSELSSHYEKIIIANIPAFSIDTYYKNLLSVTQHDIKKLLRAYFNQDNCWIFYCNKNKKMINL